MTDDEVRAQLRLSPDAGCRALMDTYFHYAYAIVFHILRGYAGREDVEECVMDVFLEVIRHFDTAHDGSVKAYVGTTAKRKAIDRCRFVSSRSKHIIPLEEEQFSALPSAVQVEETVERNEQSRILMECILSLGKPDADIIIQKFFYDRSSAEIADIVGLSPPAVRMRCSRAMKQLRKTLQERNITL